MRFKILPRYVDGIDMAPVDALKNEKVYLIHQELTTQVDGMTLVQDEEPVADILDDPSVIAVADKLTLADEIVRAALEDMGVNS